MKEKRPRKKKSASKEKLKKVAGGGDLDRFWHHTFSASPTPRRPEPSDYSSLDVTGGMVPPFEDLRNRFD